MEKRERLNRTVEGELLMKHKRVSLIVNPRSGQNLANMANILAIFAAAGWKTDLALKEYSRHTMTLATKAAEDGSDFIIAYGGDGTLNQVVNGIMHAKNHQSIVGLIPGGTANVWASEIGVPADPVHAALALLESEARKVDIGHLTVERVALPEASPSEQPRPGKKSRKRQIKATARVRQHFLLMAGLGIDAAIMEHVSQPLKYRLGALAVGASAAKELPTHHPFPVEIRAGDADNAEIYWKGEAIQLVIGNTRLYADIVQITPGAHIDDGILDVCVITSGNPLTTMQQIASLLLRHHPDNLTAEYFQGAHFSLSVPASVALQLDGSAVKLKNYLSKSDQEALARVDEPEQVMVTYHFDALPHAVSLAIPHTYSGALFEMSDPAHDQQAELKADEETEPGEQQEQQTAQPIEQEQQGNFEQSQALLEHGRKVTVVGVSPNQAQRDRYVVAGIMTRQSTGEVQPVAIRIDTHTLLRKKTGEDASLEALSTLRAGNAIVVEGKKRKRGVILAKQIIL
ncbi:MAG TPA: diacylglycerol kinase family protein [Ktedonobacteraceae bacterium]